jgi:CTP:phosphocholine cytidylyltransferase-like protein
MGSRLGLGTTKALVEVDGKPLIVRHLEMLEQEQDIRVVVGYQAEAVIETVRKYRDDVLFVFNHQYRETGTGASVALAAKYAGEYILSLDGDLLVHPEDMKKILACSHEFVSGGPPGTDDPWMLQTYEEHGEEFVSCFSKNSGTYEWNGITQMKSRKMLKGTGHVFQLIEPYLPVPFLELRTREIDTVNDYERAVAWVQNHFC